MTSLITKVNVPKERKNDLSYLQWMCKSGVFLCFDYSGLQNPPFSVLTLTPLRAKGHSQNQKRRQLTSSNLSVMQSRTDTSSNSSLQQNAEATTWSKGVQGIGGLPKLLDKRYVKRWSLGRSSLFNEFSPRNWKTTIMQLENWNFEPSTKNDGFFNHDGIDEFQLPSWLFFFRRTEKING